MNWLDIVLMRIFGGDDDPRPPCRDRVLAMLALINLFRIHNGASVLKESATLSASSQMATNAMVHHEPVALIEGRSLCAEVIPSGHGSAHQAIEEWSSDDGDARSILLGDFDSFGAGTATSDDGTIFWCVEFA